jgi:ABC-2 type transport system permease protein
MEDRRWSRPVAETSAASTATGRAAGTIYDLGYQHYTGPRYGRWHVIRTLAAFSFAAAFGRGRGSKAQVIPYIVMTLVFLPAVIQIGIASALGNPDMISYANYLSAVTFFLALFAAAQAPEVIVADRQYGVLSLYLSRSLSTLDYVAAKLIAFVGAMLALTLGPQIVLFFGKIIVSTDPWTMLTTTYKDIWPIVGGTFIAACYMAFIGLALAAFAARRAYASASVIAFFVFMPAIGEIAKAIIQNPDDRRYTILAQPFMVITGFANWLWDVHTSPRQVPNQFGARNAARALSRAGLPNEYYLYVVLGTCAVALLLLALRYRKTEV